MLTKTILVLVLFFPSFALAEDYTVSTSSSAKEKALTWEAKRTGKTEQQVLQDWADNKLDDIIENVRRARETTLRQGYENASPKDKVTIEAIVGKLP